MPQEGATGHVLDDGPDRRRPAPDEASLRCPARAPTRPSVSVVRRLLGAMAPGGCVSCDTRSLPPWPRSFSSAFSLVCLPRSALLPPPRPRPHLGLPALRPGNIGRALTLTEPADAGQRNGPLKDATSYSPEPLGVSPYRVTVCSGCCDKIPRTGWLKRGATSS